MSIYYKFLFLCYSFIEDNSLYLPYNLHARHAYSFLVYVLVNSKIPYVLRASGFTDTASLHSAEWSLSQLDNILNQFGYTLLILDPVKYYFPKVIINCLINDWYSHSRCGLRTVSVHLSLRVDMLRDCSNLKLLIKRQNMWRKSTSTSSRIRIRRCGEV